MRWMVNLLDRNIDPREKIRLNYTLHWITQAWRNDVLDQTIQNCFNNSTVIGRTDQMEGSPEALELSDLYQSLTDRLPKDAQEVMPLDDFLNPSDENDADETDLSDIVLDLSGGDDGDDQDEEYISGPPPDLPSGATVIDSMQEALLWAQHQEGTTEENIRQIECLIGLFTRLQVDGRKQKTLEEMNFLKRK
jgi:hypothetical protein